MAFPPRRRGCHVVAGAGEEKLGQGQRRCAGVTARRVGPLDHRDARGGGGEAEERQLARAVRPEEHRHPRGERPAGAGGEGGGQPLRHGRDGALVHVDAGQVGRRTPRMPRAAVMYASA